MVGCALNVKDGGEEKAAAPQGFSHEVHTKAGSACKSCHMFAAKSAKAGMPNEMLCGFCHKTVYDGRPVGELYNMKEWMAAFKVKRVKYSEIKMSHKKHLSMGVKCESCHGDIAQSSTVAQRHIPVKGTCFTCHGDWNTPDKCDACHKEIRHDIAPPSHTKGNFIRSHGIVYRDEAAMPDKVAAGKPSCSLCHSNDHCVKCHEEQQPENHTNQWRLAGHGISAGIDRGACATCHKTDFCSRCHESTRPRSHSASGWSNPSNRHCQSCHFPVNATGCGVCHQQVASHSEQRPGSHVAGWGNPVNRHCASCHVETSSCSVCHQGTPSHKEVPPASHTGDWGSPKHSHCTRCHLPVSVSFGCKECHNRAAAHFTEGPARPDDLPHSRGLMCRACHFTGSPTLTHADNGSECRLCHKRQN